MGGVEPRPFLNKNKEVRPPCFLLMCRERDLNPQAIAGNGF